MAVVFGLYCGLSIYMCIYGTVFQRVSLQKQTVSSVANCDVSMYTCTR